MTMIAATLLAALALLLAGSSLPRLRQALGDQNHPEAPRRLIASLRRLIVGTALGVVAAGVFSGHTWLLAFGLVFLFEEIFECSVHLAIVRSGSPSAPVPGRH
jgi:hypothetical protein